MKRQVDKNFKKKSLIASIVASGIWLVMFVMFIPLAVKGILPNDASRYLAIVAVLAMIWVPFGLLMLGVKFDFTVLLVYFVFIILSVAVGSGFSVYQKVFWYDTAIHFLSGVLIGFIGYTLIGQNSKTKLELFWLFVFVVAFAMLCGGIWEIYEFLADVLTGSDMQVSAGLVGQKALLDTMIDIICDFGGGLIAGVSCVLIERSKRIKAKKEQSIEVVL